MITFSLLNQGPLLMQGLLMTFCLWLGAIVIGVICGIGIGIVNCQKLIGSNIRLIMSTYIFIMRGIPLFVQLLIAYFIIPELLGFDISPFIIAIVVLGLCSAAYIAEIIRTGINAISAGQWEAAQCLGFSKWQTFFSIVFPQVIRLIIPALANEFESIIKSTAILSAIGVMELTKVGQNIVARYMNPECVYLIIALLYLIISGFLKIAIVVWERRQHI